jgi:very-short-patch-repair endonuclease
MYQNVSNTAVPSESAKLAHEALERLRARLLDLSKRNTLLNFRDTRKTLHIIDELPNEVFNNLVRNGNEMLLLPLDEGQVNDETDSSAMEEVQQVVLPVEESLTTPEIDESSLPDDIDGVDPGSAFTQAKFVRNNVRKMYLEDRFSYIPDVYNTDSPVDQYARKYAAALIEYITAQKSYPSASNHTAKNDSGNLIDTNLDVPEDSGGDRKSRHVDNYLQTRFEPAVLERRCKTITTEAKTAIEETGSNLLYIVIGFLEWTESDDSSIGHRAPLILVPMSIEKKALDRESNCYRYGVSYTEEGIDTNLSLAHKLEKEFGLILPEFGQNGNGDGAGDSLTPEQYLRQVEAAVVSRRGWSVRRQIVIGFFSFAKMQIYRDLDPSAWSKIGRDLIDHPTLPLILAGIGAESGGEEGADIKPFGEEYPIDDTPDATPIILDADSSQHSAIIDIIQNQKNLVIEGPPGTGKSQTISNIVAAALSEGKTVLFLAEKKAALDVVKRRLDAVGMGDFCLELHSHKAGKAATYEEIRRRMQKRYSSSQDIKLMEILREKELRALKAYSDQIGLKLGVTELTTFEIFTAAQRWKAECKGAFELKEIRSSNTLDEISPSNVVEHESFLTDLALSAAEVPSDLRDLIIRFLQWHDIDANAMVPGDEVWFGSLLSELKSSLEPAIPFISNHGYPCDHNSIGESLDAVCTVDFDALDKGLKSRCPNLFKSLFLKQNRELCTEFITARDAVATASLDLSKVFVLSLVDELLVERLAGYVDSVRGYGYAHADLAKVENHCQLVEKVRDILSSLQSFSLEELPELSGTLDKVERAVSTSDLLVNRPSLAYGRRLDGLLSEGADGFIKDLSGRVSSLLDRQREMAEHFNLSLLPGKEELLSIARGLKSGQDSFFSVFNGEYRRAKKSLNAFSSTKFDYKSQDTVDTVLALAEIHGLEERVKTASMSAAPYLGNMYDGLETDFEAIFEVMSWCESLRDKVGIASKAREVLANVSEFTESFSAQIEPIRASLEAFNYYLTLPGMLHQNIKLDIPIEEVVSQIGCEHDALERLLMETGKVIESDSISLESLHGACEQAIRYFEALSDLRDGRFQPLLIADGLDPQSCDIDVVKELLKTINTSGVARVEESKSFVASYGECDPVETVEFLRELRPYFDDLADKSSAFSKRLSTRQSEASKDFHEFWSTLCAALPTYVSGAFARATSFLEEMGSGVKYLQSTLNYLRLKSKASDVGFFPELDHIVGFIGSGHLDLEQALVHYRANLYMSRANETFRRNPEISGFIRSTHEARIERYKKYDRDVLKQRQAEFAHSASTRSAPQGNKRGLKREWTEKSLLEHQINLQRRHIPIRQLVRRAGRALQAYKPCFMMSPLSVAQYLAPGYLTFDLVVMDEASQLRPEDALGGIIRGKQLVVVGDPKQLPPTSFFNKLSGDEESEDAFAIEDAESILDICITSFDTRRLRWHYRSEHESLIAFSNQRFYDEDLLIFPSPHHDTEGYGVRGHYVEGATYKQRKSENLLEAEAVVLAIIKHFKEHPTLSLGVATFNKAQSELISDRLEAYGKKDSAIERQIAKYASTNEPFFIKNLENVQGDERDVIFVSTTYGPDAESGIVAQRFGPINMDVGWRRLNVIMTRAKKRLDVFTSLKSSNIIADENSKRGVRALKDYLEFLETGYLPERGKITGKEPDSDFEIDVARELNELGFETVAQVGVAGFFIDLAIVNPRRPGEFLIGIECDGASYHSAKSTRDRDRLRQEVLESKGWTIHRIWSTDWFVNREKEIERLHAHIKERLSLYPEVETVRETTEEKETTIHEEYIAVEIDDTVEMTSEVGQDDLRKELVEYRKQNIDKRFVENGKGILSPAMLDLLVQKKPIDKDEFFAFVPQDVRVSLDSFQVKTYLNDIFEIIEEYV